MHSEPTQASKTEFLAGSLYQFSKNLDLGHSIGLWISLWMCIFFLFLRGSILYLNLPPNPFTKAVSRRCSVKKVFWKIAQNQQENSCARVPVLIKLAKMFSCEFYETFKSTFFKRTPPVTAFTFSALIVSTLSFGFKGLKCFTTFWQRITPAGGYMAQNNVATTAIQTARLTYFSAVHFFIRAVQQKMSSFVSLKPLFNWYTSKRKTEAST